MTKGKFAMHHTLFAIYTHPRETWIQQKGFLHERIIPMVKSQPGFMSGTWTYDSKESRSYGCVKFGTELEARALEAFLRDEATRQNPMGVAMISIVVTEVVGEASAT